MQVSKLHYTFLYQNECVNIPTIKIQSVHVTISCNLHSSIQASKAGGHRRPKSEVIRNYVSNLVYTRHEVTSMSSEE